MRDALGVVHEKRYAHAVELAQRVDNVHADIDFHSVVRILERCPVAVHRLTAISQTAVDLLGEQPPVRQAEPAVYALGDGLHAVAREFFAHGDEPVHLLDLGGGSALLGLQFSNAAARTNEGQLFGENSIIFQFAARQLGVLGFQTGLFCCGVTVQTVKPLFCVRDKCLNGALAAGVVRQVFRFCDDRRRVAVERNLRFLYLVLCGFQRRFGTRKALLRGGNALLDQLAVLEERVLALLLMGGKGFARLGNLLCRQRLMAGRADGFRELFRVNRTPAGAVSFRRVSPSAMYCFSWSMVLCKRSTSCLRSESCLLYTSDAADEL